MDDKIEVSKVIETSPPSLGLQLFVVTSIARSLKLVKENLPEHRSYLRELELQNILFGAGPLWTPDGQYFEGDGMLVYRGQSVLEVEQLVNKDPMHLNGARDFTIRPWLLNDGSITIKVSLSEHERHVL